MFVDQEHLRTLTGYKRPADQRQWLNKRGYRYEVHVNGQGAW